MSLFHVYISINEHYFKSRVAKAKKFIPTAITYKFSPDHKRRGCYTFKRNDIKYIESDTIKLIYNVYFISIYSLLFIRKKIRAVKMLS